MTEEPFKIALFDKALHDRSAFSCGVVGIDNWLKNSLSDQIKNHGLRLWCATNASSGELVGFYALNAHSIRPQEAGVLAKKGDRHPIPVLYLPCIAIASSYQGNGVGNALMGHATRKAIEVSETIASKAIILDVHKDEEFERRMAFYKKRGFEPLGGPKEERVYLTINDAKASHDLASKLIKGGD